MATDFPTELRVNDTAEILGVSASTVMELYHEGLLPARNAFPPSSSRKSMRFPLDNVVALRTSYNYYTPSNQARQPSHGPVDSNGHAPYVTNAQRVLDSIRPRP